MDKKRWYLGMTKKARYGSKERAYLEGFEWAFGLYWSGGGISTVHSWSHFDDCFLSSIDSRGHSLGHFYDHWTKLPDYLKESGVTRINNGASVWEPLSTFLDDPQYDERQWGRIKDLFIQFYRLRDAAEVFQHGGHCTSEGRTEKELVKEMADKINKHIEEVIIPEIEIALLKNYKP